MLDREFEYFLKNRNKLLKKYEGKYIVIKGENVIGAYNTEIEAYEEAQKENELGTFLIQPCSKNEESYKQTFHSRVIFS